jgi:hypothetical protein
VLDALQNILAQNTEFGTYVLPHRRSHARSTHNVVFASGRRTDAGALVNDTSGSVFTDTLLMPPLHSAYRGSQRELAENGVSVLREQQDIELDLVGTTGVTNTEIRDVSSPQLPTDCLMPHVLRERATANTCDVFVPI